MTRLLLVSQPVSDGVAIVARDQVETAIESGYSTTVVCPGEAGGPLAAWSTDAGAEHIALNMERAPSLKDLSHVWRLRRWMIVSDIVLLHSSKAGVLGRVAAMSIPSRKRPAVVVTPHAWSWSVGGVLAPLYRLIERVLANQTDAIVAVSEGEAAQGRRVLGARARLRVIHNGVNLERFSAQGPIAETLGPTLVCVGRLSYQKAQDLAIVALSMLRDDRVRLRLVGDGETRGHLEEYASQLGVADRVEFVGYCDPRPHLRAAIAVIVPSRWDGLSLALLEAMACGAPVVAAEVAGTEVAQGVALVVPADDAAAIAEACDQLIADDAGRAELARRARKRVEGYDLNRSLQLTRTLWADVIDPAAAVDRELTGELP